MLSSFDKTRFKPIQDGGERAGQKDPSYQSFPVTSVNEGVSRQNFLAFAFNTFTTLA